MTAQSINIRLYFLGTNVVTMFSTKIFGRDLEVSGSPFLEISGKSFAYVGLTTDFALSTSIRVL